MCRRAFFGLIALAAIGIPPAFGQEITSGPREYKGSIEKRLREPITLNFKNCPLRDAIKAIAIQSGVPVVPDTRSLNEARINMDWPLSGSVDSINMKNALNILFEPMKLRWIIEDNVIKITTQDRNSGHREKAYKIGDILDPEPMVFSDTRRRSVEVQLMQLIQDMVAKDSWEEHGGKGKIRYDASKKTLVVCQDQETHEEVQLLLATLRRLQDLTVRVEIRFLHCNADLSKRFAALAIRDEPGEESELKIPIRASASKPPSPPEVKGTKGTARFVVMDDANVLRFIGSAPASPVVLATTVSIFNGQRVAMSCLDKSAGWRYEVQPTASPNRREVRLNLTCERTMNDGSKERVAKASGTFTVKDQHTLVWHLGESAGQHLFVLVRPRVIVREPLLEEPDVLSTQPIPGR